MQACIVAVAKGMMLKQQINQTHSINEGLNQS